jgi:hypothetical protein
MKIKTTTLLLISSLVLSFSCGQAIDHEKEVRYYVVLNKIRIETAKPVYNCIQAMSFGYSATFTKKPGDKMDSNTINWLKKMYPLAIQALDSAIYKLNAIEELDSEINLKGKMLSYYRDSKTFLESAEPKFIDMLTVKNGELTNEERQTYSKLTNESKKLNEKEISFDDVFVEFRDKHHVTGTELK